MGGAWRRPGDGAGPCARTAGGILRSPDLCARPVSRGSTQREYPQLADREHALRRADRLRRRDPLGHELRPGARPDLWPLHQGAEPGPRVRALEPLGAQELLDALQLTYFVE